MSETSVAMGAKRRDEFLGRGGTGVLSLSTDEGPPHAVPVSYGYESAETIFYFRLAAGKSRSSGLSTTRHGRSTSSSTAWFRRN